MLKIERLLGEPENIRPYSGFLMGFQLGKVEIRAGSIGQCLARVVKQIESEINQPARCRRTIDENMFLHEMPAPRSDNQHRDSILESVLLAVGIDEFDRPVDSIAKVDLSIDDVVPGRSQRVLAIGHEDARAGVECIDHHLAIRRPRDFHAAVLQIIRCRGNPPVAFPDFPCR